jgi:hypothetical protein
MLELPDTGREQLFGSLCTRNSEIEAHTQTTPLWRRSETGAILCNACSLYLKMKGCNRPVSLKSDVIKHRNRSKGKSKSSSTSRTRSSPSAESGKRPRMSDSESVPGSDSSSTPRGPAGYPYPIPPMYPFYSACPPLPSVPPSAYYTIRPDAAAYYYPHPPSSHDDPRSRLAPVTENSPNEQIHLPPIRSLSLDSRHPTHFRGRRPSDDGFAVRPPGVYYGASSSSRQHDFSDLTRERGRSTTRKGKGLEEHMSAMQVADRDRDRDRDEGGEGDGEDFGYRSISRSRGRAPVSDMRASSHDDDEQQVVDDLADELDRCGVFGLDGDGARTLLDLLKRRFPGYEYIQGEWEALAARGSD